MLPKPKQTSTHKTWIERHPATMTLMGNIITVGAIIATIYFSNASLQETISENRNADARQRVEDIAERAKEKLDADRIAAQEFAQQRQIQIQDTMQRQSLFGSQVQNGILSEQLRDEKQSLDMSIKDNAPWIKLENFKTPPLKSESDTLFDLVPITLGFTNSGARSCKPNLIRLSVVNTSLNYDTTFINPVVNIRMLGFSGITDFDCAIPSNVLSDESTLYFFQIRASDDLMHKQFVDSGYFKQPISQNGGIFWPALDEGDINAVNTYVQQYNIMSSFDIIGYKQRYTLLSRSAFNRVSNDSHTVLVSNSRIKSCQYGSATDNCWVDSIYAKAGDTIGVQIYFHNDGVFVARRIVAALTPRVSGPATTHLFSGALAENNGIVRGSAKIISTERTIVTYIGGSLRIYTKKYQHGARLYGDDKYLFGANGINIGDIAPGWEGQGVLVASYIVTNAK